MAYKFTDPAKYPYQPGSLFLGLDPATNHETGIKTEVHAITFGGSGTGKGASLIVQNARRWPQSLTCIDPKGENAVESWQAREAMGQLVGVIDPFHEIPAGKIPDRLRVSVNLLADIDPESPRARAALSAIGNGLVVSHNKDHMEWTEGGRALLAGLAAYVCTMPAESRTFATLRQLLTLPTIRPAENEPSPLEELAADMLAADHPNLGALIREAGGTISTAVNADEPKSMEKQFLGLAKRATRWLDDGSITKALAHSDFRMSALKTGRASLFLVLPADYLADYSGFLRLFVKSALNAMGQPGDGGRCLFLLDEFYSLGRLDELTEAAGRMRSYGVQLWPFLQGISQLFDLYGKEASQTFLTNAGARVFLGNDKDRPTLDYISYALGNLTPNEITAPHVPPSSAHLNYLAEQAARAPDPAGTWFRHDEAAAAKAKGDYDNAMRRHREAADAERIAYDHQMRRVGQPRLTPDEIAALVGKDEQAGEKVARSMIVMASVGDVMNLRPAPYFQPLPAIITPAPDPEPPAPQARTFTVDEIFLYTLRRGIVIAALGGFAGFMAGAYLGQIGGLSPDPWGDGWRGGAWGACLALICYFASLLYQAPADARVALLKGMFFFGCSIVTGHYSGVIIWNLIDRRLLIGAPPLWVWAVPLGCGIGLGLWLLRESYFDARRAVRARRAVSPPPAILRE